MNCPKCQASNRERRTYCRSCGVRLTLNCPQCGFGNEDGDSYCGGCGQHFSKGSSAPQPTEGSRPSQTGSSSKVEQSFLAKIFEEETSEVKDEAGKTKKPVIQDDIKNLFGT